MNTVSVSRKTLEDWALSLSQGDISPRWEIEDLLAQPEQPEAGRDLAAHIAEAIEQERFEIMPADLYRKALEEVIRDALKVFRPQAQAAVAWTFSREDFKELAFDLRRIASSGIMANEKPLTVEFARMVRRVCTTAAHMLNDAHDNYFVVGEGNGRD